MKIKNNYLETITNLITESNKDPIGGLYIHLFQPIEDISEPGKKIKAGMSVVKPGKFKGKLSGRMKTYHNKKYWHFQNGESAFAKSTTRKYLLLDATNFPEEKKWLITGLEDKLVTLIKEKFNVISKIGKGKSEYREIEFNSFQEYDAKIKCIYEEIHKEAEISLR